MKIIMELALLIVIIAELYLHYSMYKLSERVDNFQEWVVFLLQKRNDGTTDRKTEPQTCEECEHWNDTEDGCADRHGCKDEPMHDIHTETHERVKDTHDKTEPQICDTCRYYNDYIPCGSTPSACEKADIFAKEFVAGLMKLKPQTERSE